MGLEYTVKDHAEIKALSLKWWTVRPTEQEDIIEYALLQYRLKDYEAAVSILRPLVAEELCASFYLYADCLYYHSGREEDRQEAVRIYRKFLENTKETEDLQVIWQRGMCFAYGLGTEADEDMALKLFLSVADRSAEAEYEIGCAYKDGRLGLKKDRKLAEQYLRNAYDHYAEEAIFALYDLYGREWDSFPYQRELTEACSYRIGKYMRAAHVNPSVQTLQNLADLYLQGFPGDTGEDDARFKRKADKYLKKIEELKSKQ